MHQRQRQLARDNGELGERRTARRPSPLSGALRQWLNPKAWLACVAGIGAFVGQGETALLWQFSLIYLVICYLSQGCWAWAGALVSRIARDCRSGWRWWCLRLKGSGTCCVTV